MRILVATLICSFVSVFGFAQSRSVWIADYTAQEVVALVSGMTTLIYCGGATHADGPAITMGKHVHVASHVAQRIAEELGNALVLPINPYAEQSGQMTYASPQSGRVIGGTIHLSPETYAILLKDIVNSAIISVRGSDGLVGQGFKNVMIMGDHTQGQDTLKRVSDDLDRYWKPKGVRVFYIDEGLSGKSQMNDYLTKLDKNIRRESMTGIDDAAELMAVDSDNKWVRKDKIDPEKRIASVELGKIFIDQKVNSALQQIRKLTATAK